MGHKLDLSKTIDTQSNTSDTYSLLVVISAVFDSFMGAARYLANLQDFYSNVRITEKVSMNIM